MSYEDPPLLPHDAAAAAFEAVLGGDLPEYDPNSVLIGLGLYDSDRGFVEQWAVLIGERTNDASLRDSAALALGHLARRFGEISDEGRALSVAQRTTLSPTVVPAPLRTTSSGSRQPRATLVGGHSRTLAQTANGSSRSKPEPTCGGTQKPEARCRRSQLLRERTTSSIRRRSLGTTRPSRQTPVRRRSDPSKRRGGPSEVCRATAWCGGVYARDERRLFEWLIRGGDRNTDCWKLEPRGTFPNTGAGGLSYPSNLEPQSS
jgi:hypothetical protein